MNIRSKLIILALLPVTLAVVAMAAVIWTNNESGRSRETDRATDEITKHIFELNVSGQQYVRRVEERPKVQFEAARKALKRNLDLFGASIQEDESTIENIRQNHRVMGELFSMLVSLQEKKGLGSQNNDAPELRERIVGQLLASSSDMIADAQKLSKMSSARIDAVRDRGLHSILLLIFVSTLGTLILSYLAIKSIINPVRKLKEGTEAIAGGDLTYQVEIQSRDELGNLAKAFNAMAGKLQESHVSIKDLEEEIAERKRAEEELRESEARFRSVLDNSRDVIYRLNVQTGRYEYISPSAEAVVGFSADELMALDIETALAMIHPDDVPVIRAVLARVEETGRGELEYRQRTKSGEYRWISNHMALIKDNAGRPLYRNGNIRDITDLKLAEKVVRRSEERYRNLFNSLIQGFCIIEMEFDADARPIDYRFLEVNTAFEEQTGLHDAQGKFMRDLAPELEARWFEIYGKIALTGEPAQFENEAKALHRWYEVRAFRVGGPESRKVAIGFNDITKRKRAEEELRRSRDELEMRVRERTVQLEESGKRLRELASELINAQETERKRISHELHDGLAAQLAAVKYRVEHRLKNGEPVDGSIMLEETIKDIETAITETRRIMANLRPSVLDDLGILPALSWYSRETGKSYPGTSLEYSGNVEERDVPENLKIVLFRVVQESIANAVRHGKCSQIQIGLKKDRNWLRLSVEDNGNGFVSVKKSTTGGIGLDSMQQRVESSGGIFSIRSNPGKGTFVKAEWRIN